jgi:hypothetical protein
VDSGEWRPDEGTDSTPWTDRPAAPEPAADLWGDDSPDTWAVTQPWRPRQQADSTRAGDRASVAADAPATGYGTGGYPTVPYRPGHGEASYGPASYGQGGYAPAPIPVTHGQPGYGQQRYADEPAVANGYPSTGSDQRSRPDLGARHRSAPEHPSGAIAQPPPPPPAPPRLGRVLGLTAVWYAIPTVAYLIWLVALSDDRPGSTGTRQLSGTLPWLLAAVVVSMGLCLVLRRLTVGWRSLGVSFAAAIIGGGLATIIHSFAA